MSEAIGQPGQAALPRPLGIGEILSMAFQLYRRHWRRLLAITRAVAAEVAGEDPSVEQSYRFGFHRLGSVLLVSVLVGLAIVGGHWWHAFGTLLVGWLLIGWSTR